MTVRIKPKYEIPGEYDDQYPITPTTNEPPAIGSHLITPRTAYTHHGIYIGDDKVIHYAGLADGLTSGVVEATTLEAFSNGNGFTVKSHTYPRFTGQSVIDRARSRLGEDDYNVFFNNCEHFCEWCVNGEHRSEQIEQAKSASSQGLVASGRPHLTF